MNEWKVGGYRAVAAPAQWWWWLYVCLWLSTFHISHCHRKKGVTVSFSEHWNRRDNKELHTGSKLCACNVWHQHWGQEHSTYNTLNTMVLSTKGTRWTDLSLVEGYQWNGQKLKMNKNDQTGQKQLQERICQGLSQRLWSEKSHTLPNSTHRVSAMVSCSYFQPQSVISGMVTEPRVLTNLKSSGLVVKQKCMLTFTMLYKTQKINLLSDLLIPPLTLGWKIKTLPKIRKMVL